MIKIKLFTALGLGLLLCGCSATHQFTGKYISKNGPYSIQFHKDSTFSFEGRSHHFYQKSTGKWKRVSKRLIMMNSDIKNVEVPLNVSRMGEKYTDSQNVISLHLAIKGSTNLSDYRCKIFIDNELLDNKRADSLTNIQIKKSVKSIFFQILKQPQISTSNRISDPLITQKYYFEKPFYNRIDIEFTGDESHFFYQVFNENPVKEKNGKIRLFNLERRRWDTLYKVPDETLIFIGFPNSDR